MESALKPKNIQLDATGKLIHLISTANLPQKILTSILDNAQGFINEKQEIRNVPVLANKTIANLFFENSTRTRCSFELAEKHLGLTMVGLNITTSSVQKGETFLDTVNNLQAMGIDLFVIRHPESGIFRSSLPKLKTPVIVINAGDGQNEHPTQGLLDALTIRQHKPDLTKLSVVIIGDVLHSRVARSQIYALKTLGVPDIRLIGPKTLLPLDHKELGATVYQDLKESLKNVDVITVLRLQEERMENSLFPNRQEYFHTFGITPETLKWAKPDAIVLHPGPLNRGVEIESSVADGPQSVILQQVKNGVAVRMAVIQMLLKNC
jgi:aspartate carbamoyltransferase catalytic subunit